MAPLGDGVAAAVVMVVVVVVTVFIANMVGWF
jgi:hypothetical protein